MAVNAPSLLINNIIYGIIQIVLLAFIIGVTYRSYIEYKKKKKISIKYDKACGHRILFIFGLLFNITAFFCIFGLFYKAIVLITNNNNDRISKMSIFFPCNLVFLQNTFLMIVLVTRIYYIFDKTSLQINFKTIIMFIIMFIISTAIFFILLTTKIRIPGVDSWFNCAVTLCVFNIIFAVWMTSLFLTKLTMVFKKAITTQNMSPQNAINEEDMELIQIITKTTLLSVIPMIITFISCLLLLFRFSLFGENIYVTIISEWVISIDIFANFICYSLSFGYYKKYYLKLCAKLDRKCATLWLLIMFGAATDIMFDTYSVANAENVNSTKKELPSNTRETKTRSDHDVSGNSDCRSNLDGTCQKVIDNESDNQINLSVDQVIDVDAVLDEFENIDININMDEETEDIPNQQK